MFDSTALVALLLVLIPGTYVLLRVEPSARLLLWEVPLVAIAWIALEMRGVSWADVGLHPPASWTRTVVLGGAGAAVLLVASFGLRIALERLPGWRTDASAFEELQGNPRMLAGGIVFAWAAGALGEELLYRGFLLDTLHALFPGPGAGGDPEWWVSLAVTSAVFGLAHSFQGRPAVVIAFFIGAGYGGLVLVGGSLWPAILAHGLYDTVAFSLVYAGIRT